MLELILAKTVYWNPLDVLDSFRDLLLSPPHFLLHPSFHFFVPLLLEVDPMIQVGKTVVRYPRLQ
jgi:hypothetical protein